MDKESCNVSLIELNYNLLISFKNIKSFDFYCEGAKPRNKNLLF